MIKYFINVILGVLIRPRRAMEYALNDSSALNLLILLFMGGSFGVYGTIFVNNLFMSTYINDMLMTLLLCFFMFILLFISGRMVNINIDKKDIFFVTVLTSLSSILLFLFTFTLFCIFSKMLKTDISKKDIFFATLLTGVVSMWIMPMMLLGVFLFGESALSSEYNSLKVVEIMIIFGLPFMYIFYIVGQLLNTVQKASLKKSFIVVSFTVLTLLSIVGVSKYFEKEQRDLGIYIYKVLLGYTSSHSTQLKYYDEITKLYENQDKYEEAINYYKEAVKIEEDNVRKSSDYYWIAEDYKKLGHLDLALQYAKKSLALTPKDEDSLEQVRDIEEQKLAIQ